jgi:hypothetical protein
VDSALTTVLVNGGAFGVVLVVIILGLLVPRWVVNDLKEENAELKATVKAERDRADAATTAAQGSRDVIAALQSGLQIGMREGAHGSEQDSP